MATRSKRLFGPTIVGTSTVVLYTCPDGETALLKHVAFFNPSAVSRSCALYIGTPSNNRTIMRKVMASETEAQEKECFIVLQPGETLQSLATAASVTVTGFGAELEGVAD